MENIEEALKNYGLNIKEIAVYQDCLRHGNSSITQIAKESKLKRPTTYLIVESLREKGLLVEVPVGKKIYYKPIDPEKLVDLLDRKREKLLEAMPFMRHWYNDSLKRPKVTFYEGKEQIKKIYNEIFNSTEIWAIVSLDKFFEVFTYEEDKRFFNLIKKQGGKLHDLVQYSTKNKKYLKVDYRQDISVEKFLPKDFQISTDTLVNDQNKLALVSLENESGVLIEDEDIAQTQKKIIQYIWNSVK